jgi:DNA-binding transcriptional LysR family regulator
MVGNGIGLAIIPETAARRCKGTMAIGMVRLSDPWAVRQLHVCARRPVELPLPARLLFEHLREVGRTRQ